MREELRIPVFNEEFLFNVYKEIDIEEDKPNYRWIDSEWQPERWEKYVGPRYDQVALLELHRLLKFKTCPLCREPMEKLSKKEQNGNVFVCRNCFYWGGRGTRGQWEGPPNGRGNLGRMRFTKNADDASLELLINHFTQNIDRLINLSPKQAEKLLPFVLKDFLDCEVKTIGGVKDGGIDALAIRGESEKILIQVKWRERRKGSEAISVVREVGGTLLARGIPNGMIISTKNKFSKPALKEAELISERELVSIGKLNMELADFNDLIDMFDVSVKKRKEIMNPEDIIPFYEGGFRLFG